MTNPEPNTVAKRIPPRVGSALLGGGIGLVVGVFWTIVFGPLTDGPPSIALSFVMYTTGFCVTGLAVGAIQRYSILVGALIGLLAMAAWTLIVGPRDGWITLWLMVFGISGIFWGAVIGFCFWVLRWWIAAQRKSRANS
jgi:hypothetical protein